MHRPLREPLYLRIWRLVRGVFLYNTVYWRRASDGLNMPTLSAEEREAQRPERNLEIIRPRMRPRARLDAAETPVVGDLTAGAEVYDPLYEAQVSEPEIAPPPPPHRVAYRQEESEDASEQVYVKRRRYRRKRPSRGSAGDRGGFFARVFGKR